MLRVANIIEDGRLAGPQVRIASVASALKENAIETTVIHPEFDAHAFAGQLDAANIERIALPIHRLARAKGKLAAYLLFFPWEIFLLWRVFRREKFALVHCSGGGWQIKGLIAAKLAGTRAIWHLNDTLLPGRLRPTFLWMCRWLPSGLIVAGERVRQHYLNGAPVAIPVVEIQAPVDCRRFDPDVVDPDEKVTRHRGINVITVANLNPLKGIEFFIDMAAALNKRFDDVQFHVVGPVFDSQSEYHQRLSQLIEKHSLTNVHFHGPMKDVRGMLQAADLYVCTSIAEASPIAVWEAMAMKKAIVSTDVGDVARFVRNGVSGFVVPVRDVAALVQAVGEMIQDDKLRLRCGEEARRTALEHLDLRACATAHANMYRDIGILDSHS